MKKLFIVIYLISGFGMISSFGAVGCQHPTNGNVYRNNNWWGWSNLIQDDCPSGSTTSTQFASVSSSAGGSCLIGFFGLTATGSLVNYDILNCPIDDYIPFLILISGGLGFVYLRKKENIVT